MEHVNEFKDLVLFTCHYNINDREECGSGCVSFLKGICQQRLVATWYIVWKHRRSSSARPEIFNCLLDRLNHPIHMYGTADLVGNLVAFASAAVAGAAMIECLCEIDFDCHVFIFTLF